MRLNDLQIPVVITTYYDENPKIFIVDKELLLVDQDLAVNNLFKQVFDYINEQKISFIFVHNLGSFDGYFIAKFLVSNYKDEVKVIMDPSNSFVLMQVGLSKMNVTFLDSMRMFPVSLDNLCRTFGVEGKIGKYQEIYNDVALFENIDLFNEFTKYALQDSIGLYKALVNAQLLYNNKSIYNFYFILFLFLFTCVL
jgi:hypothetical protein